MRCVVFIVLICGINELVAQTIPKDKVFDFIACLPVTKSQYGEAKILINAFQDYAFCSSQSERQKFVDRSGCEDKFNRHSGIMVGVYDRNNDRREALRKSMLYIHELNKTVTLMNDYFSHEGQNAVVAIWRNNRDSLHLEFIVGDAVSNGLGFVYLEDYALFKDSSIVIAVRKISEGYANILFIRLTSDKEWQFLYESPTYYEFGDYSSTKDANGRAYKLKNPFSQSQSVLIPELKEVKLENSDAANMIVKNGQWSSVDLWDIVQNQKNQKE